VAEKFSDLFAFDLDGTLVHRSPSGERDIPPYLKDLVFELSKKAHIIVATGRRYKAALVDIEKLPVMPFHIVHNGLVIKNTQHQTIQMGTMPHAVAYEIAELYEQNGYDAFFVSDGYEYGTDYTFTEIAMTRSEAVRSISQRPLQKARILKKTDEILNQHDLPILEVATLGIYSDLIALREKIEARLPAAMRAVIVRNIGHSNLSAMEIFSKAHSKGTAVDFVKTALGVKRTICVGDDGNDIEMLKLADVGVVMDHAEPHIRSVTPYHVSGPEGLARYLEEYLAK